MEQTKPTAVSATVKAVFLSTLENCRYYFQNGKPAVFQKGKFLTNVESEIKELMAEIDAGHPHIHVDKENFFMDTKYVDPMEVIRAQIRKELEEEARMIAAAGTDMGQSDQILKLTAGNTRDAAEAMSGSSSGAAAPASTTQANTASVITPPVTIGARTIVPGPKA